MGTTVKPTKSPAKNATTTTTNPATDSPSKKTPSSGGKTRASPSQKSTVHGEIETAPLVKDESAPVPETMSARRRKRSRTETSLMEVPPSPEDPKEAVEVVLQTFDAIRRRLMQVDEVTGAASRAEMKSGSSMSRINLRANSGKRIGPIPGIFIGDIFFFRLEILLAGLHQQSMGGIDSAAVEFPGSITDTVAVSIVSSGGTYDDDTHSIDSLVYSGQGAAAIDQKLEKNNLALERSLHWKNDVRVIRAVKESGAGRIYVYDGMYRVEDFWTEKAKSGFNVFKFKLIRQPDQPAAFAIWKAAEVWKKEGGSARGNAVRCLDLSGRIEFFPVVLVNELDSDPGPKPFLYISHHQPKLYSPAPAINELSSPVPERGCGCEGVCVPGNKSCACVQLNGGDLPYNLGGQLVRRRPVIFECGESCKCSETCRNRLTRKPSKLHFEVFKTENRGWGLRSWDPIRCGSFVCEFVGDHLANYDGDGDEDEFVFVGKSWEEGAEKWNYGPELVGEAAEEVAELPMLVALTSKERGNVARFMNHSCSPNLFWQAVVRGGEENGGEGKGSHGLCHVMFFAMRHIPPMMELTFDYGAGGLKRKAKNCSCGSHNCRGTFYQG